MLDRLLASLTHHAGRLRVWFLRSRGAVIGSNCSIGPGLNVPVGCCLRLGKDVGLQGWSYVQGPSGSVDIADGSSIDLRAWIACAESGFFRMGCRSYIGCNSVIGAGGGVAIGSDVLIGQRVSFHSENHVFSDPSRPIREQGLTKQGVVVEDDVWIGSGATILDGVVIGRGAVVAAGAVVTRSVEPYSVVGGVPAKTIHRREGQP